MFIEKFYQRLFAWIKFLKCIQYNFILKYIPLRCYHSRQILYTARKEMARLDNWQNVILPGEWLYLAVWYHGSTIIQHRWSEWLYLHHYYHRQSIMEIMNGFYFGTGIQSHFTSPVVTMLCACFLDNNNITTVTSTSSLDYSSNSTFIDTLFGRGISKAFEGDTFTDYSPPEYQKLGTFSLSLTLANIIGIIVGSMLMFRVHGVLLPIR